MAKRPTWLQKFIGRKVDQARLDECGWEAQEDDDTFEKSFDSAYHCGGNADQPPKIILELGLREGIVTDCSATVYLFVFNPPFVGYKPAGKPPAGQDRKTAESELADVMMPGKPASIKHGVKRVVKAKAGKAKKDAAEKDYVNGIEFMGGDRQNIKKAIALLTRAAEAGHKGAMQYLSAVYGNGDKVPFDREKAMYWLDRWAGVRA